MTIEVKMSQMNLGEAIAVTAVLEMGEVAERTPLCLVQRIKTNVKWLKKH